MHVLLIDDHAVVREGLKHILEACAGVRCTTCGTAEDALASVAVIEQAYASLAADHWVPVPSALDQVARTRARGGSAA